MRDFKGMKRQRGRNRSGGGGGGGGGGGKPSHNVNRAFDSNGPDNVKIRGHAQHVFEKYQQLARDASASGDRVLAENYLQHAEHYFRVLRSLQPHRTASEIIGRDALASGFDIDFEDESGGEMAEEAEAPAENGEGAAAPQGEERQDRGEGRPEGRPEGREGRPEGRSEGRQEGRSEGRQDRFENRDRRERRDRFENRREDRGYGREGQGRPEGRDERRADEQPRDPMPVIEPEAAPLAAEGSSVLRSQDGGVSHAPAFLQAPTTTPAAPQGEEGGEPRRRGRPRRRPRSFEAGEGEGGGGEGPEGGDEG